MRFSLETIALLLATVAAVPAPDATPVPKITLKLFKAINCKNPTTPAVKTISITQGCVAIPAANSYNYTVNAAGKKAFCTLLLYPTAKCASGTVFNGAPAQCNNNINTSTKLISAQVACGG